MPHLQISASSQAAATAAAKQPLSQYAAKSVSFEMQRAHTAAKSKAAELCARYPGIISLHELGEVISQIEADQLAHATANNHAESLVLCQALRRLQTLYPTTPKL